MGSQTKQVSVGAVNPIPAFWYSKNRVSAQLSAATAFYTSPDANLTSTNGFLVPANTVVQVNEDLGFDIEGPIYVLSSVGNISVTVTEGYEYD